MQQTFSFDPILRDEVAQLTCESPRLAEAVDALYVEVVNQFTDCRHWQIQYPLQRSPGERTQQAFRLNPVHNDECVQPTCQSPRLAKLVDTLHVQIVNQVADGLIGQPPQYPLRDVRWGRLNRVPSCQRSRQA